MTPPPLFRKQHSFCFQCFTLIECLQTLKTEVGQTWRAERCLFCDKSALFLKPSVKQQFVWDRMLPPRLVKRFVVQYESVRLTNKCDRGCSLKTTGSAFSNGRCLSLHNRYPCFFHPIVSVVLFYSSLLDKDLASHVATPHMQRKSLSHSAGTIICGSDHAKDESEKERCV